MKCEIEFLPVGDASRAGDCIVVRYGEEDSYELMVIDGGTIDSGGNLVKHLRAQFGEDVTVAHAVLTHADADHASGMRELFKEIKVANLWMHIPWLLAPEAIHLFSSKNWTADGLEKAIKGEYDILSEILDLAVAAGTNVYYPFQGAEIGPFSVLSPSKEQYLHLLPQFDKTPDPDKDAIEDAGLWIEKPAENFLTKALGVVTETIQKWVEESWYKERLRDGSRTSASNESSVILYANISDNRRMLLTGDGGVNALSWAVAYAKSSNLALKGFSFVQIPHHGSRNNVGPTILNELIGPILPEGTEKFTAFVSAPADNSTHPRKMVLNAFVRRGGRVHVTQGTGRVHWGGFAQRAGYDTSQAIGLSSLVEEYD
ncbi:MBL fold metallo-hydrolase [Trinickia mobilis]|uniref:MBL fold metallo-hydrolase n=1 Tax=Trinickia mobilis TaxID=2816356 RepID=UPI001A90AD21|nr:MBL fold metallo-hydrolase [Trinickia mobilis]